jgi:chromosome segregation ATPase
MEGVCIPCRTGRNCEEINFDIQRINEKIAQIEKQLTSFQNEKASSSRMINDFSMMTNDDDIELGRINQLINFHTTELKKLRKYARSQKMTKNENYDCIKEAKLRKDMAENGCRTLKKTLKQLRVIEKRFK